MILGGRAVIIMVMVVVFGLRLSRKIGLLDKPGRDVQARKQVPTLQGIFLYFALVLVLRILYPDLLVSRQVVPFILGAGALVLVSVIDEGASLWVSNKKGLTHLVDVIPSRVRLIAQVIIIVGVIMTAGLYHWEFQWEQSLIVLPDLMGILVTLGRFLLFINAINWFDYAYGQASGLSFLGFITIIVLVVAIVLPHYTGISVENFETLQIVIQLATVCAMISLIYTVVEYKPSGLLRDAGVMVYGFALAYLSLLGGAKIGTILVALSLPLFDAFRVVCHRVFVLRKNPMKGDYTHLHHRLMALGRNKTELRRCIWLWSIIMMVLILLQGINRLNKIIIFGLFALVYFGVNAYLFRYKKLPTSTIQGEKG